MNQGTHPEELPAEVLDDVAGVVGAEVTLLGRLPGGVNGGAMRVQLAGRANAVLKAVPRAHRNHLDETLRAQGVVTLRPHYHRKRPSGDHPGGRFVCAVTRAFRIDGGSVESGPDVLLLLRDGRGPGASSGRPPHLTGLGQLPSDIRELQVEPL